MKFGHTYTIYVQTEAQRVFPKCPYVNMKKFKKLLKRCPHLITPEGVSAAASPAAALAGRVVITECDSRDLEDSSRAIESRSSSTENAQVSSATDNLSSLFENLQVSSQTATSCPTCDAEFFPDLDKAVAEVVGCFNSWAEDLLKLHMASGLQKYLLRLRRKLAGNSANMSQVGNTLVSYGCMNSLAVRKILKKYDKIHSSEVGRTFKSRLQGRRMELLQSPLLMELGALAVNLTSAQVPSPLPLHEGNPGHHSCYFDDEKQTITYTLPDGLRLDFDLTCSICLEIVFDPIALGCGHIFCNSCACTAASVSMFQGVNAAKWYKKCPICRQPRVYPHAVQMGELHTLVSERCSSYYSDRLPAEREKRVLDAKRHWEIQTQRFLGL